MKKNNHFLTDIINKPRYYVGPMSKNIVDAILEFCEETGNKIGFIPSRRQVDHNGGYVNNWTTEEFSRYVGHNTIIKRDHSGPDQGYNQDDGFESLKHDCKYLDMIHIDPWKKYPKYEDGLKWTIDMIKFCFSKNPNIEYEIGTEQTIRYFGTEQIDMLLRDLKNKLQPNIFEKIKYIVIQSGTSLKENSNTGNYNSVRLNQMIDIAKKYNLLTKEHNGDYLPIDLIKEKFDLGLDAINIAPEFGQLESLCYLDEMGDDIEDYYKICYDSKRWEKWVDKDFIPKDNKKKLIEICGHYVLSDKRFLDIKPNIDDKIKKVIREKLEALL